MTKRKTIVLKTIKELNDELKKPMPFGRFKLNDTIINISTVSKNASERVKNMYYRRIEAGKCVVCGKKKPVKDKRKCKTCQDKENEWQRKYKAKKK